MENEITLLCLIIDESGEPMGDVFPIDTSQDCCFHQLKDKIIKNGPTALQAYKDADLFLWKPKGDIAEDDVATLSALRLNNKTRKEDKDRAIFVRASSKVRGQFQNQPPAEHIHLLVQLPRNRDQVSQSHSLSPISFPVTDKESIIQKHVNAARNMLSPSLGATVSNFASIQAKNPILNGRPFETRATPVYLYHSAFTTFTSIYKDKTAKIPLDIQKNIFDLCYTSSKLYGGDPTTQRKGESQRIEETRVIYRRLLDESIEQTSKNKYTPDGMITTRMRNGAQAIRGIFEDKNEIGTGSCDPNVQAALSYAKCWTEGDELKSTRMMCPCPSFVIGIAGPWIAVHGAVLCDAGWIVQPLTNMINLGFDPYDHPKMVKIARLFLALRTSLKELDTFYKELEDKPSFTIWPSICTYPGTTFEYQKRLVPDYLWKAIFLAHTPNNEKIVVKFTNSYFINAHRLLEQEGLAPRLRYFSGEDKEFKKPGGLLEMVVMDFVEEVPNLDLKEEGKKDIQRAISILHEAGYVFGDLRPPNILNLKNGHAMLIDFDWSGIAGQVLYPMGLNKGISWPMGADTGCPIEKDHDILMLNRLGII